MAGGEAQKSGGEASKSEGGGKSQGRGQRTPEESGGEMESHKDQVSTNVQGKQPRERVLAAKPANAQGAPQKASGSRGAVSALTPSKALRPSPLPATQAKAPRPAGQAATTGGRAATGSPKPEARVPGPLGAKPLGCPVGKPGAPTSGRRPSPRPLAAPAPASRRTADSVRRSPSNGKPAQVEAKQGPEQKAARATGLSSVEAQSSAVDEDLDANVDAAVDALQSIEPPADATAHSDHPSDMASVTETFTSIAAIHSQQLHEFMAQLALGSAPGRWASSLGALVAPIKDAATQMELTELSEALGAFTEGLKQAETQARVSPEAREVLTQAYARMVALMPDAFSACVSDEGRGRALLEALMLQVPGFRKRTLERLYAAGLHTLEQLASARSDELTAVLGIDSELADAIVKRVEGFEHERTALDSSELRDHLRGRLRATLSRLAEHQRQFEQAEEEDSAKGKRVARRAREVAALELDVVFAQLGELPLIEELKRSPMHRKITRVEAYLGQGDCA